MSTSDTAPVPHWPKVRAEVRADGSAEVTINGTSHPVSELTVEDARSAVLDMVRTHAAIRLGRPVRVDTTDPSGQWQLIVHPDGAVQDADRSDQHGAGQPDRTPAHRRTEDQPQPPTGPASTVDGQQAAASPPVPIEAIDPTPFATQFPSGTAAPRTPSMTPPPAATGGHAAPGPLAQAPTTPGPARVPTLDDLLASRPTPRPGPARMGWQGKVRRATGGLIKPTPSAFELEHRAAIASVQRSLTGPKTIVVVNPKGGAHKTTATLLLAATFGIRRGGYTLAWDNNETRGTLGWRANPARHTNTAVDLLRDLERFTDIRASRVGDLDNYVRAQGSAQFDVLASDEDAASAASIDADAFQQLHHALQRFYRVMVIDTGNNMRASNWQAAIDAADQLVIVSTVREDTAQSAAWLVDALRSTGPHQLIEHAVTVLSAPGRTADPTLRTRLQQHFSQLTRTVLDVPHDPTLVPGGPIDYDALAPATRDAWLRVTAAVADGL